MTTSWVCLANSREGQMVMPHGPSPFTRGILVSARSENMIMGRANTSVLPDPGGVGGGVEWWSGGVVGWWGGVVEW